MRTEIENQALPVCVSVCNCVCRRCMCPLLVSVFVCVRLTLCMYLCFCECGSLRMCLYVYGCIVVFLITYLCKCLDEYRDSFLHEYRCTRFLFAWSVANASVLDIMRTPNRGPLNLPRVRRTRSFLSVLLAKCICRRDHADSRICGSR